MGVRGVYPPGTLIEEFVQDLRRMLGLPEATSASRA
jgi:methylmalonyl-CoA mutase cobalamin-binding subunit